MQIELRNIKYETASIEIHVQIPGIDAMSENFWRPASWGQRISQQSQLRACRLQACWHAERRRKELQKCRHHVNMLSLERS